MKLKLLLTIISIIVFSLLFPFLFPLSLHFLIKQTKSKCSARSVCMKHACNNKKTETRSAGSRQQTHNPPTSHGNQWWHAPTRTWCWVWVKIMTHLPCHVLRSTPTWESWYKVWKILWCIIDIVVYFYINKISDLDLYNFIL